MPDYFILDKYIGDILERNNINLFIFKLVLRKNGFNSIFNEKEIVRVQDRIL